MENAGDRSRDRRGSTRATHLQLRKLAVLGLAIALPACAGAPAPEPAGLATRGAPDPVTADHPLAGFFGNTMVVVEHGKTMRIWYHPDRTFAAQYEEDGFRFKGVWESWGTDFCQTQTSPARPGEDKWRRCGKIAPYKVGDSWERTSPDGSTVHIRLIAGE